MQTLFTPAVQTADMGPLKPLTPGNSVSTESPESFACVFEATQKETTPKQPLETPITSSDTPVIPTPEQTISSAEAPPAPLFIQASIQSLLLNLPEPENGEQSETVPPVEPVQEPQMTDLLLKGLSKDQETPLPTEEVQVSAPSTIQEPLSSTTDTTDTTKNTASPAPEQSPSTTEQTRQVQPAVAPSPAAEMAHVPVTAEILPATPIPATEQTEAVTQVRQTDAQTQPQTVSQAVLPAPVPTTVAEPEREQGREFKSEQGLEIEHETEHETDSEVRTFLASPTSSTQQTSSTLPVLKQTAQMVQLPAEPTQTQPIQPKDPSPGSVSLTSQDNLWPKSSPLDQGLEPLQPSGGQTGTAQTPEQATSLHGGPPLIPVTPESPNTPKELAAPSETPPRPATESENLRFAPLGERIRLLRQAGQNQMRLNLQPAELGRVSLQILQKEQELHLHIFTDTVMAKELLESQIGQLKQSLMQQGLHLQQCQIEVNPEHNEHSGQGFSQERPPQQSTQARSHNLSLDWDEAEFELDLSALPLPQPDANHVNYLA
jgi:flagellar hook-length control protein FliK